MRCSSTSATMQTFYSDCIYENVEGINDAREFIIKERADGGVCFWYKPDSSHHNLYPSVKDEEGLPVKVTEDGEETYAVCPYGIEIFTTTDGPHGFPPLAPFAKSVANPNEPRYDKEAARTNVIKIIKELSERFTSEHEQEWNAFFDDFPNHVEDIDDADIHVFTPDSIPKCSLRLPDENSLKMHQKRFAESIRYINKISGHETSFNAMRTARALEADVPILKAGAVVCVLPPEDALETHTVGERLPFWLGIVQEDEEADIGMCCTPVLAVLA
mmetsp:Transcript_55255/g.120451  ORF Transcript_55255/g.120451 Transcript_55255/m.120451 type:complete len:273 (-) Transcript_55255:5-823(-)